MDNLIAKYLIGDLSLEEQYQLAKWLESPGNKDLLNKLEVYWKNYREDVSVQKDEVEKRILEEINMLDIEPEFGRSHFRPLGMIMKIAASIALLLISFFSFYEISERTTEPEEMVSYVEKATLPGQIITTKLPDGTTVKLNADSRLIVPDRFEGKTREIELIGEAFFEVQRDESKPFVIKTSGFSVQVLGTSFNVKAYPNESNSHVAVKTGKVSVSSNSNLSKELSLDQMVNIDSEGTISAIGSVENEVVFGWIDRKMVLKDQTLYQVIEKMERWYGITITLENNIQPSKTFTATFSNPTLKEVLESVSKVYKLKYDINQPNVRIYE
ncbi:FecR family protein [Marinoscillum sp. MHG1-6]|uniref:FecR family protein n=1 Tax=Marinoscillum sp. MHG1-6 TaxID=2959627 RepID=UPI0021576590|nr:FecR family protein [Marinoscillum sp. MHG1-6]